MPLEHKLPKTISEKGAKEVRQITSGNKTQITVLGCASATGQAIPPMVVFSGKRFNHELSEGEVPGTLYGMSDSGWMDMELFSNWFTNHFLKHAVSNRPIMLLLDGHSSHYTLELMKSAAEQDVVVFCLPPHTTADSQPLDTSCFGPLKTYWGEACRQFMFSNPGRVILKIQFSTLFSETWSKGMSISNIVSGFRWTGIYPFNPNAILDKLPQSTPDQMTASEMIDESPGNTHDTTIGAVEQSPQQPTQTPNDVTFTLDELELYNRRFENGFNIFTDKIYVAYLDQFHPGSVPSVVESFTSVVPLEETGTLVSMESRKFI